MTLCLFCRIAAGEIPAQTVLETDSVIAFADIAPAAPVHVLVVPKTHHESLAAMAAADGPGVAALFAAAGEVALSQGVADSGYRLVSNVGPDSGQAVPHVHVHVLGGRNLGALLSGPDYT